MAIFSTSREAFFLLTHPSLWFRKAIQEQDLPKDPLILFDKWFKEAQKSVSGEFPNAMCLSTLNPDGYPEGRIVLMKRWDGENFIFFTNSQSQKGKALEAHPKGGLTFYWEKLQRQVRIVGDIVPIPDADSDSYFSSRPRRSQIGAWASKQSDPIENREELLQALEEYEERFAGQAIPRPEYWGGYRMLPKRIEFWELRLSRLHDRFQYTQEADGGWTRIRLSP